MSIISWGLVFPNVQKGQGCSTALVFLNLFHLQHLHNNVWGIRENKPPNSKTSGDLSSLNPLYEFAFWCSFWELRRGDPRASLQMMMLMRGLLEGPASEAHRLSKRSKGSRMLYSPCVSQPFPSPILNVNYFLRGLVFLNVQKGQGCSTALVFHDRFHFPHLEASYFLGACLPERSKGSRMLYRLCVSQPFQPPTT